MPQPARCSTHARYRGALPPASDCPACTALYNARHPLCACGCGGRVKLGDRRPDARYATPECRTRHLADLKRGGDALESFKVTEGGAEVARLVPFKVRTKDDLVRACEIDEREWDVIEWECKAYQQTSIPRSVRTTGDEKWVRPSAEPVTVQMFTVRAKLRPKSAATRTLEALSAQLVADIRAEVQRAPQQPPRFPRARGEYLFEFTPVDLHMGKLTWGDETVTHYDLDLAAGLFDASLEFLLERALKLADGRLDRILCLFGNDASHIDNKRATTTAGTPMDVDTRYIKIFRRLYEVHRRAVERLRQVAPVDVVIVPGNHDELTSFHLGEILAARYDGTKHVTVDNGPKLRKYYEYGRNLLGFTHGDAEKVSELPLLMAREVPDAWARCDSREWHLGHKHIEERHSWRHAQDLFSDKGVRVRRLASLSAHDAWHTKHGYTDRRACDSFLFHKVAGFTDHLSFNVDHFTGKALSQ